MEFFKKNTNRVEELVMRNEIKLTKEKKAELIKIIKAYFEKERDEELGDLAASIFLDFITTEIGPEFYNQGVLDSYRYINEKTEDLLGIQKY
jgi:uncharacterized protein (DUF2164 family)